MNKISVEKRKLEDAIVCLEKIIPIRNELAHQKEINIIRTQEIFSRAFPILQQLKQEIESLIYQTSAITKEKRIFEQFSNNIIGTESQKQQMKFKKQKTVIQSFIV